MKNILQVLQDMVLPGSDYSVVSGCYVLFVVGMVLVMPLVR